MPAAVDTLKFSERLEAAGVVPAQAEAIAEAASEGMVERLVARADISEDDGSGHHPLKHRHHHRHDHDFRGRGEAAVEARDHVAPAPRATLMDARHLTIVSLLKDCATLCDAMPESAARYNAAGERSREVNALALDCGDGDYDRAAELLARLGKLAHTR